MGKSVRDVECVTGHLEEVLLTSPTNRSRMKVSRTVMMKKKPKMFHTVCPRTSPVKEKMRTWFMSATTFLARVIKLSASTKLILSFWVSTPTTIVDHVKVDMGMLANRAL